MQIAKSAQAAAELAQVDTQREAVLDPIAQLEEDLETQRITEWINYGYALAASIRAAANGLEGLNVPIEIDVDAHIFRPSPPSLLHTMALPERLVSNALLDSPTPADLPGTPLQRLEAAQAASQDLQKPESSADDSEEQ